MVRCFYHSEHRATARCEICGRPLCPICDHRLKRRAYCQDCIVRGVQMLQAAGPATPVPPSRSRFSPMLAALAALIPGLGAAYNGQRAKALTHFLVTVGLFQMAELTRLELFGFGGVAFYLYSIMDAYRTACAIEHGLNPAEPVEPLRGLLQENVRTWAGLLIALGIVFFVATAFYWSGGLMSRAILVPVILIGLAIYLLWRARRPHQTAEVVDATSYPVMMPTALIPPTAKTTGPSDSSPEPTGSDRPD